LIFRTGKLILKLNDTSSALKLKLTFLLLFSAFSIALAQNNKSVHIKEAIDAIKLDGLLNEQSWQQAEKTTYLTPSLRMDFRGSGSTIICLPQTTNGMENLLIQNF